MRIATTTATATTTQLRGSPFLDRLIAYHLAARSARRRFNWRSEKIKQGKTVARNYGFCAADPRPPPSSRGKMEREPRDSSRSNGSLFSPLFFSDATARTRRDKRFRLEIFHAVESISARWDRKVTACFFCCASVFPRFRGEDQPSASDRASGVFAPNLFRASRGIPLAAIR